MKNSYSSKRTPQNLCKECKEENPKIVLSAFVKLTGKYADVIQKYFLNGNTLQEIASEYGCTREYIRQVKVRALRKMRNEIRKMKKELT